MQPVADQITAFLLLVLLGNLVGIIFDCYRFFRRIWKLKRWGTNFGDAFFWLVATVFTYVFLLKSTWGEVRLYVFCGIALGLFAYLKLFSTHTCAFLEVVYRTVKMLVKVIIRVILPPLKLISRILLLPFSVAASFLSIFIRGARRVSNKIFIALTRLFRCKRPPPAAPPEN